MAEAAHSYVLDRLTRRFPGVLAVDNVELTVEKGEIHGIIGRNGAGKSVLVSMVAGLIPPTSGMVRVGDAAMSAEDSSPIHARRMGVSLITQEPKFARSLTVVDNLFMGQHITGGLSLVRPGAMAARVEEICARLSLDARPGDLVRDLPIETQQLLAFGKAVFIDEAKVILLDEITASLTQQRKAMLLRLLKQIAASSPDISFTVISHHIAEIIEFTDRVTVMRDGRAVATIATAETTREELAAYIVGNAPSVSITVPRRAVAAKGAPVLKVSGLACRRELEGLSFSVDIGEVVGFAGLEGSGKDAAIEALFGLKVPSAGEIVVDGAAVSFSTPRDALAAGVAFLPKDREAHAVIHGRSVEDNTLISSYARYSDRFGLIRRRRARAEVERRTAALRVKTPSILAVIDNLSGGNKQKVMFNRLALTTPRLFLLNEPTRGVDISAKPQLLKVIREELALASAVVMISESEEELVEVCDRVIVFFAGRIAKVIARGSADFNVGEIYRWAQGVRAA